MIVSLDDSTLMEAGRAIRPFISELVAEPAAAAALDRGLASALARADTPAAATEVLTLLIASQATADWLIDFENLGYPPAFRPPSGVRGVFLLDGDGELVRARRFRCPKRNDFTWYRRSAAQPIPLCPTDEVRLVPDRDDLPRAQT
jgi:hypothetical protein